MKKFVSQETSWWTAEFSELTLQERKTEGRIYLRFNWKGSPFPSNRIALINSQACVYHNCGYTRAFSCGTMVFTIKLNFCVWSEVHFPRFVRIYQFVREINRRTHDRDWGVSVNFPFHFICTKLLDLPLPFPVRKSWVASVHLANRASPSDVVELWLSIWSVRRLTKSVQTHARRGV